MKKWGLPKGWEWRLLSDVSSISNNIITSDKIKSEKLDGQYVGLESIESGSGRILKLCGLDSDEIKSNKFIFTDDDILYGKLRPYLNKVAMPDFTGICSTDILTIKPIKSLVEKKYLGYWMRSSFVVTNAEMRSSGANLPRINPSILMSFPIPLPPLETQQRIVAILDKAEEIKRLRAEANAQTQKLIQSVFLDMFGDPVKNPKGWTVKPFGTIAKLVNGKAFKPRDWKSSGLPIIRIQNLNNLDSTYNYYDGLVEKRYLVRYGDLLFAWSGTPGTSFGAHIWAGGEAVLNQHIYNVIVDNKSLNKKYLEYAINGVIDSIIKQSHGSSGLAHITKKELEKVGISCPPIALQNEFESIYQKITETIIDNSLLNTREFNSLSETVLRNAFTGELVA